MAGGKEIRTKIKSVQNTRKITKAMEMVAASKMRKAQDRMWSLRPYAEKVRQLAANLSAANITDYRHCFLTKKEQVKRIGVILVTTDKGLCGGLNTNILRSLLANIREWQENGVTDIRLTCIGNKGLGFVQRMGGKVMSQVTQIGDVPTLEKLRGPVKVMIDAYMNDELDAVYVANTRFINTMKQEATIEQLLPLMDHHLGAGEATWDYVYEPDAQPVIDTLLMRYLETVVLQAVAENMASEQSARMVAMKAATDNAGSVIKELQLIYNKARQASITKEISEIVGGAAAIAG